MASTAVSFVALVLCFSGVLATDEYLTEVQQDCKAKSDLFSCGKYEAAKFIATQVAGLPGSRSIGGLMQLVTLNHPDTAETLFPAARQMSGGDSDFRKFTKFLQRQVDAFLGSRALAVPMPSQVRLVDSDDLNNEIVPDASEARLKKKKSSILIPLIMLFKLFKVKVLLALVLFGVLFIKKALIFLFLLAPSYLNMLKVCKTPHYQHAHIEEDFGGTGYGYAHASHGHHPPAYAKEWANSRAYAAYKPT